MFDLEDEDLWLHVEFWALGGVRKHVDYQFAIHTLIMMMMIIIIITIIIVIIFGIERRRRTC